MITFILGLFVGAFIGMTIMAIFSVGHDADIKNAGKSVTNYVQDGNFEPPINWAGEEPQEKIEDSDKFKNFM